MTGRKPDERIRTPMRWDATSPGAGFTTGDAVGAARRRPAEHRRREPARRPGLAPRPIPRPRRRVRAAPPGAVARRPRGRRRRRAVGHRLPAARSGGRRDGTGRREPVRRARDVPGARPRPRGRCAGHRRRRRCYGTGRRRSATGRHGGRRLRWLRAGRAARAARDRWSPGAGRMSDERPPLPETHGPRRRRKPDRPGGVELAAAILIVTRRRSGCSRPSRSRAACPPVPSSCSSAPWSSASGRSPLGVLIRVGRAWLLGDQLRGRARVPRPAQLRRQPAVADARARATVLVVALLVSSEAVVRRDARRGGAARAGRRGTDAASALDAADREAADEVALEEEEHQRHRAARTGSRTRRTATSSSSARTGRPCCSSASDSVQSWTSLDEHRDGQVLGPAAEEAEEPGDRDRRHRQRQDDLAEDLVLGRPVHGGRLLEVPRDRVEVALEVPDRERQLGGDRRRASRRASEARRLNDEVAEVDLELVQEDEQRDDRRDGRQHQHAEDERSSAPRGRGT